MKLNLKKNGNGNGNGYRNGNGKSGTLLKAALLALAVLLVGTLLFRQVDRLRGPRLEAWVASADLAAGARLSASDLERGRFRASELPDGALEDRAAIEGQQLVRPKAEGEPFVAGDVRPVPTRTQRALSLAELLPPGRVLTPVRVAIESVIVPELKFGDRLEIVSSTRGSRGEGGSRVIASDAFFLAWVDPAILAANGNGGGNGESGVGLLSNILSMPGGGGGGGAAVTGSTKLLLALYPRDVLPITEAEASGARLTMVLHGRREVEEGQLIDLPKPPAREVELIAGRNRETVDFVQ